MYKKNTLSASRRNSRRKNIIYSKQINLETFFNNSSKRISSKRFKNLEKPTRPSSSTSSIFSQKLNFKNDKKKNFNILNLMIENNPNKFNYKKLKCVK